MVAVRVVVLVLGPYTASNDSILLDVDGGLRSGCCGGGRSRFNRDGESGCTPVVAKATCSSELVDIGGDGCC